MRDQHDNFLFHKKIYHSFEKHIYIYIYSWKDFIWSDRVLYGLYSKLVFIHDPSILPVYCLIIAISIKKKKQKKQKSIANLAERYYFLNYSPGSLFKLTPPEILQHFLTSSWRKRKDKWGVSCKAGKSKIKFPKVVY